MENGTMERLASFITHYMYKHKYIEKEQIEWLHYAIIHRGMNSFTFVLLFSEGLLLTSWDGSLLFIGKFRFLRTRTGGYHAETPFQCFLASVSITYVSLKIAQSVTSSTMLMLLMVLAGLTIIVTAPSNNQNIHLSQEEINALKPRIVFRTMLVFFFGTLVLFFNIHLASCIAIALTDVSVLLLFTYSAKE